MPAYIVQIPKDVPGKTLIKGADAFVVHAADVADAKRVAQSMFAGDANDQIFDSAVVTEIEAGTDLEGFKLQVVIYDSTPVINVEYTAQAAETLDDMADAIVPLLNAESIIAGAAYTTPNLTIAAIGDGLGDRTVGVFVTPPATLFDDPQPIAAYVGTITDEGIVAAALAVALVPGADVVQAFGGFESKE